MKLFTFQYSNSKLLFLSINIKYFELGENEQLSIYFYIVLNIVS